MGTPRAARHRDLEQRIKDLERQVRELTTATLRRPKLGVTAGDFTVQGGNLRVIDADNETIMNVGGSAGISRPWMPWYVVPANRVLPSVNIGSWAFLYQVQGYRQHPYLTVIMAAFTDSGTTGEVRVTNGNTGEVLLGPTPVDLAETVQGHCSIGAADYQSMATYYVEGRVTSGTGKLDADLLYAGGTDGSADLV